MFRVLERIMPANVHQCAPVEFGRSAWRDPSGSAVRDYSRARESFPEMRDFSPAAVQDKQRQVRAELAQVIGSNEIILADRRTGPSRIECLRTNQHAVTDRQRTIPDWGRFLRLLSINRESHDRRRGRSYLQRYAIGVNASRNRECRPVRLFTAAGRQFARW